MTGGFYVIPESQVKHEGSADLEVVLHVTGVVIRDPPWLSRANAQAASVNSAKQEAGESITGGANQGRGGRGFSPVEIVFTRASSKVNF